MRTFATQQQVVEFSKNKLQQNPIYLDTETTGLESSDEIVEISIVDLHGIVIFDSLIKPLNPIPDSAIAIHHIGNEMVDDAPRFPDIWPTISDLMYNRPIGMYNAEFDVRLIKQSMSHYGQPIARKFHAFDIMNIFSDYRGTWDARRNAMRRYRLEDAGRYLGITLPNSHRSLDDTLLTRAVFHKIAGHPY